MYTYYKKRSKIILFYFITAILFFACNKHKLPSDEWGILVIGLPKKVSVLMARRTIVYYILKQTHEPILRKDDGENFTSRILNKWERNPNYSEYTLCPNTFIHFDRENSFTFNFFANHIEKVTKQFDPDFSLIKNSDCVIIKFKKRKIGYLDFLTRYENAPSIKKSEDIEIGLGAFYVKEIGNDKIILQRKSKIKNGYNRIVLYEYKGDNDLNLENRNIKDFNLMPNFDIPKWVINEYYHFANIELKTIALIINHPDKKIRKLLYNCIDPEYLRKSYYPKKNDFYDVQTILPIGIPGAKPGKPVQKCGKILSSKNHPPIIFANWMYANQTQLKIFWDEFVKTTNLNVNIIDFKPQELVKVFNKYPRPYNLVIIVFDAVRPDPTSFFDSFVKNDGFHDFTIPEVVHLYNKMIYEEDEEKKKKIVVQIADKLAEEYLVLPLYQSFRELYYPKEIKNITVGCGFLQYPEVAEFRW